MATDARGPRILAAVVAVGVLLLAATEQRDESLPEWAREGAIAVDVPAHSGGGGEGSRSGEMAGLEETATPEAAHAGAGEPSPPPAELRVGPSGDYRTLSEAIAAAPPHAVIRVAAGTYREFPLSIDRPLTLLGEGWPVLDGEGTHSILEVNADSVHIEGFELRGAGRSYTRDHAAVRVEEHRGCRIVNNRLEDNFFGIYLARARDCEVRGNRIRSNATREADSGNGIHLWDVDRIQVHENRISGHRDGIYLEFARAVIMRGNTSEENLRYGLHFMFSHDSFYQDNVFRRNGAGVAVMYTRNVVMSGNRFEENWGTAVYGLLLKDVQDSLVEGNLFRANSVALFVEGADRVTFRMNRVERNGWAVRILGSSQDNFFTANDFVENTFDVTTNSRRSENTFERNYWSAYRGYDLAGDGFGDVPHRPVRLFSYMVERKPAALILLRSFFVEVLEVAERVLPVLTPEALVDLEPRMRQVTS
jgi:nitrous oxidase accessory protein